MGESYAYPARAIDPDFDSLTYTIVSGPVGMSILAGPSHANNLADPAGNVAWVPEAKHIGTYVPVTLKASDGRGGEALQSYRIYVRPAQSTCLRSSLRHLRLITIGRGPLALPVAL